MSELIIDNFAGGGGASTGIALAIGRSVDIAINHDPAAIAMHRTNHPDTKHYCESVWDIDPVEVTAGRPVALCWFSPDCKHFSKAKGGKPRDKNIRGLAWVAVRWAHRVHPRVIILENVEEFKTWGPLLIDGQPDPSRKGEIFERFVDALRRQGYTVDWRELRACDYGAPTIRKRFFLVARCDGQPIVWPEPTHGDPKSLAVQSGRLLPWRTAAEIIDWSIPCPSIFERSRPLAENTMRRIARGLQRFVLENPEPFIVQVNHVGDGFRGQGLNDPLQTVTAKHGYGIVNPHLIKFQQNSVGQQLDKPIHTVMAGAARSGLITLYLTQYHSYDDAARGQEMSRPLLTLDTSNRYALCAAFLAKHFGGNHTGPDASLDEPVPTVTATDHNALVISYLTKLYGTSTGQQCDEPLHTVTGGGQHLGEVRAFLLKYYGTGEGQAVSEPLGTVTTRDRFGLVTIHGENWQIVDIGMRMLESRELFNAQGFPGDYIIDHDDTGRALPKNEQVAKCGNAVCPPLAEALVRANLPEYCTGKQNKSQGV
jgi:DNA (cytosine-5)-methyltransferase 1